MTPSWQTALQKGAVAAAAATLLAACTVGPDYRRPELAAQTAYRHDSGWQRVEAMSPTPSTQPASGDDASPIAADPATRAAGQTSGDIAQIPADQPWWQGFGDAPLDGLMRESVQANQTLAQAEARYRQARASLGGVRAEALPTVSGSFGASRGNGSASGVRTQYDASASVSWTLDLWGRVRRQVEAGEAELAATAGDLAAARLSMQALLAQSYFQLRVNDQQRQLLDRTATAYERALQLTRNQYAAGMVARADVIQSQTQLEQLRVESYELAQSRAELEHAIAVLLGRAPGAWRWPEAAASTSTLAPASVSASASASTTSMASTTAGRDAASGAGPAVLDALNLPPVPRQLPAAVLVQRPDVAAAERRVAAANAAIGVARSAWLPDLTLGASYGGSASQLARLFDAPARVWSVGPTLAATLFDGGRRTAASQQAEAAYDEQAAAYRQTVLTAWQEVEDALAAREWLSARAAQQARLVALAQENERVVNNRYREGLVSYLELSTAQNLTFSSQRDALTTLGQQLDASVRLIVALGGDWQPLSR